jgi:predicted RecA/RadA family phage recombinase
MAKNFVGNGKVLTVVCPSGGRSSGDLVRIGSLIGVATHDAAAAADLELAMEGEFDLTKEATTTFSQGDPAYCDATTEEVNATAAANYRCGVATRDEASGTSTVRVLLGHDTPVAGEI